MTAEPATIRPATLADAVGLNRAINAVSGEGTFLATRRGFRLQETQDFMAACQRRGVQVVLEAAGEVVGWCDILGDAREEFAHGGTLGMGLLPDWRGRGWGRRLAEAALEAAHAAGLERVELQVYSDNDAGRALYESLGFEVEGIRRGARRVDGHAQHALMMAKWLVPPSPRG